MVRFGRVHVHKNGSVLPHKINCRLQLIADCPTPVSKLNRQLVTIQHLDQRLEFAQFVFPRGKGWRKLQEQHAHFSCTAKDCGRTQKNF
jgi:hypothetical protein